MRYAIALTSSLAACSCDTQVGARVSLRGCYTWNVDAVDRVVAWFVWAFPCGVLDGSFPDFSCGAPTIDGTVVDCVADYITTPNGFAGGRTIAAKHIEVTEMPVVRSALVHELAHVALLRSNGDSDAEHTVTPVWDFVEMRWNALRDEPEEGHSE